MNQCILLSITLEFLEIFHFIKLIFYYSFKNRISKIFPLKNILQSPSYSFLMLNLDIFTCIIILMEIFLRNTNLINQLYFIDQVIFFFYFSEFFIKITNFGITFYFENPHNMFIN